VGVSQDPLLPAPKTRIVETHSFNEGVINQR